MGGGRRALYRGHDTLEASLQTSLSIEQSFLPQHSCRGRERGRERGRGRGRGRRRATRPPTLLDASEVLHPSAAVCAGHDLMSIPHISAPRLPGMRHTPLPSPRGAHGFITTTRLSASHLSPACGANSLLLSAFLA